MKKVNSSFNQRVDLKYDSGISVECVQCGKAGLKGFRRIMEAYLWQRKVNNEKSRRCGHTNRAQNKKFNNSTIAFLLQKIK